ncbi:uncharacterized protein A1O5_00776 [Cladophialophora psammophila CBS 110553]|uniref:Uncharacterized protein n=1 Tax=Cladophialophora psammophila CBS 110553 TaxID=1182543 RepID=W9X7Q5_9EURO|nr:uncharacterized protein A1O5_00776 [Cladophialophora psammophila CBS 110553]EXJ76268.1 hypothetical protein A1O5_00776 [Cladophialophora psammophila CBS 110553]
MLDPLRSARPPTVMDMPYNETLLFTISTFVPYVGCILVALYQLILRHKPTFILFVLGGSLCVVLDPLINALGCCYFARTDLVLYVHNGRPIPLFMLASYGTFNGGFGYWWFTKFQDKKSPMTPQGLWKLWAFAYISNLALEFPVNQWGLQSYFGFQPFKVLGMPLWFPAVNSTMPIVAASLVNVLCERSLRGWKKLAIILIIPSADILANGAMAWPVWIALALDKGYYVSYLMGVITFILVVISLVLMGLQFDSCHGEVREGKKRANGKLK